jgi:archaea-specific DNA-binding protein
MTEEAKTREKMTVTTNTSNSPEIANERKNTKKELKNENVVFIGNKPFMNYVTSVMMQFNIHNRNEVIIKARGKFITRAVDVAEVSKKRFLEGGSIELKDIKINSEEFENKEGKKVNVSTIEIILKKKTS